MRWFWLDRFTEFVSGSHATAVKCVSLSEDHLHDHLPGYPVMPNSLVAEGMAQGGGLLVSEVYQFSELVVLAKFAKCTFDGEARPGDTHPLPRDDRASERRRRVGHRQRRRRRPPACRSRDFLRPASMPTRTEHTQRPRLVRPDRPAALAAAGRRVRRRHPPRRHPPARRRLSALSERESTRFTTEDTESTEKECNAEGLKSSICNSHSAICNSVLLRVLRVLCGESLP